LLRLRLRWLRWLVARRFNLIMLIFFFWFGRDVEVSFFLLSFLLFFEWRDPTEILSAAVVESR
jgi:hypothetical protein